MLTRLFQLLFWSALVFALVMASLPQPPALPGDPDDKILHMLAFLVLGSLSAMAYPGVRLVTLFTGLSIFGGLIEIVQIIPSLGRDPSLLDWVADMIAAAIALAVAGLARRSRSAPAA